jgi:hypothetical protein
MPTVLTEGKRPGSFIMAEQAGAGALSRETITIASGSGIVAPGTVLGKVTLSGKYVPSPNAEVEGIEGAEVAVAVNIYGADATDEDVEVAAIVRLATVNGHELTYDPSRNDDAKKLAARVDLAAENIIVRL